MLNLHLRKDTIARAVRRGRSFLHSVRNMLKRLYRGRPGRIRAFSFAVSALLTVAIVCSVFSFAGLTYALEVTVNGTSYGYVESREIADNALNDLRSAVETGDLCAGVSLDAQLSYAVVSCDSILTPDELIDTIVVGEDDYVQTVGVFANGTLVSFCNSRDVALNALSRFANGETFYFDFEVRNCVVRSETFDGLPPLSALPDCTLPVALSVPCRAGDTAAGIAERFDVPEALLNALNLTATYESGTCVNVVVDMPLLTPVTTEKSMSTRVEQTEEEGKPAYLVTDTIETDLVLDVPFRSRVVATSSKELSESKPIAEQIVTVGHDGFCWPLDMAYYNYVSSYWGDGRGHSAVDIAGHVGIPILSVLDGVVVSINSSGSGYGQHFVIDHGNGLKTLYAHCSKVYVTVGEKVSRGEVVALVGSTGYSTGSHLHFEVIRNGARVNPCAYLGI